MTKDAEFLSSSAHLAVSLFAHLSPNLHRAGVLNFAHSLTSLELQALSTTSSLQVFTRWSVRFPWRTFTRKFCHHYLFYHLSNLGMVNLSEKVNEVVHSMLPLVLGSRLNVHQSPNKHWPFVAWRMQSPLSDLFGIFFAFSFCFTFARRSSCRSVLVSFFSL